MGVIGSRISSEALFNSDSAALIGMGLVAKLSRFLLKANSLSCHFRADVKSPARIKSVIAFTSAGTMLATTLMTPFPPTEAMGKVSESSPEMMVRSQPIAISLSIYSNFTQLKSVLSVPSVESVFKKKQKEHG